MEKQKFARVFLNAALVSALSGASFGAFAATSSPNVSLGKNLYVAGAVNSNWKPEVYTDGKLDFNQVSSVSDFALNVGEGPTKLFITWETRGDESWAGEKYVHAASCQHSVDASASLQNFKVMTSANSTNGVDGDWETVAEVGESGAMSRGLAIDFAGKSWFRIVAESPVKNLEEVGAYDISDGANDTWFFMGTSISQMGIKQQDTDSTTAQIIHARFPEYTPAMLRGGIGCINSTEVVEHLNEYLKYAGNVKFWAIEMGTNDAWGGGDWNLATYKKNMQTIIDSAKAHGITPIIARIIATDSTKAGWQVNPAFLETIDKLTEENNLPKGPDFFSYFKKHPEQLASDGVHPNGEKKGGQAMHHLWAEALAPLYAVGDTTKVDSSKQDTTEIVSGDSISQHVSLKRNFSLPRIYAEGKSIVISGIGQSIEISLISPLGQVYTQRKSIYGEARFENLSAGRYIAIIRGNGIRFEANVVVK